ncbi:MULTISPECIES: DUF6107 family protein [unclassified Phyllobacterium]|uniref:DUF6107 family protein n=1 Tax=Phyllobacterium TaxID=28100 RepID=UPI00088031B6|nr:MULTISPECIES: DUF6107 family protein [unclassified Phyllobacterium]MBA8901317.1 putative membrane protein YccC [Phyllobacterium sp. P30BS-XVII]UGX84734.1 DUF6107 family protein [Phyllobacterium sp. T1293]SDP04078.1 hypothetical protein SAMN05443582_103236 [Phyllobacterium sp. OV277]
MTNWSDAAWILAAKAAGAIAGSAVSLAYMLPKDKSEAAIRFIVGIVCGLAFGGLAGVKIASELDIGGQLGDGELMLMGAAAASLAAWTALGIFARITARMGESKSPLDGPSSSTKRDIANAGK